MNQLSKEVQAQIDEMNRKIKQLERDNRMLTVMNENAKRLRLSYEAEKKVQYLYNDLLLEHCPNMIFLFNKRLQLMLWSKACLELLSVTDSEDLLNLPFAQLFSCTIQSEWIEKVHRQNKEVLVEHIPCQYNDTIYFEHGKIIHAQVAIAPILDDNNRCQGTLMTINDITELTVARQNAEEAAKSRSSFLAQMSHEIRTPMNAVKGLSELLYMTDMNELQRKYVNHIINATDSLLCIINDVLDFSKIDANKIELIEKNYNVMEMLTSTYEGIYIRIESKGLYLLVETDPRLPTTLLGDNIRIKQVIINLLSNAVKYTNEGYIRLALNIRNRDGVTYLRCVVEDSGIGICEDEIPYLFDAFTRADLRRNCNIEGTGLGLSISKQLMLAMGGKIWVKSTYGKGSTFTFEVPQKVVDFTPIADSHNESVHCLLLLPKGKYANHLQILIASLHVTYKLVTDISKLPESLSFTHCIFDDTFQEEDICKLKKKLPDCHFTIIKNMKHNIENFDYYNHIIYRPVLVTDLSHLFHMSEDLQNSVYAASKSTDKFVITNANLLIVDDNEINQNIVTEILSSFGAAVECADNGRDAVDLCQYKVFDIIFMDYMMPVMDGIDAACNIRRNKGPNQKSPIVALTANVANDMRRSFIDCGMNDLVAKPIELKEIKRVLCQWLPIDKIQ